MAKPKKKARDPRWVEVGQRIKEDRLALVPTISQAELGRRIGLSVPYSMHRYEAGLAPIPIPRLEKIAEVLGKRVERYLPNHRKAAPKPKPLTVAEAKALHLRLAQAAMAAAVEATPEAMDKLNELIAEVVASGR